MIPHLKSFLLTYANQYTCYTVFTACLLYVYCMFLQLSTNTNAILLVFLQHVNLYHIHSSNFQQKYCCFDIISCIEFLKTLWDMFFVIMKDDSAFIKRLFLIYANTRYTVPGWEITVRKCA